MYRGQWKDNKWFGFGDYFDPIGRIYQNGVRWANVLWLMFEDAKIDGCAEYYTEDENDDEDSEDSSSCGDSDANSNNGEESSSDD